MQTNDELLVEALYQVVIFCFSFFLRFYFLILMKCFIFMSAIFGSKHSSMMFKFGVMLWQHSYNVGTLFNLMKYESIKIFEKLKN